MFKKELWEASVKLKRLSLLGWIRYMRLKIQGKGISVTGQCRLCGSCCREISLEANGGWIRTEKQFEKVVREFPEYERFIIEGKDPQGFLQFSCTWHTEDGVCRDHANRLSICRNFPDKSLYFCGGEVPRGCGYQLREITPFSKYLDKEIRKQ